MENNDRVIIAGPTASGKSKLAIALAKKMDGEIISVDSRQCYKKIDIGTAKPSERQLNVVPHHNISVLDLDEDDSVVDFKERCDRYTDEIEQRGKTVIYCGGSTLHLQSLIRPLDDVPESDPENIEELNQLAEEKGLDHLYRLLKNVDPVYAEKMDGLNRQRIIRALDVWYQTKKPFSSFHSDDPVQLPERMHLFALFHPREILHERISVRTEKMLDEGLLDEVDSILRDGYSPALQALNTVGYKQAIEYIKGDLSEEEMVEDIKTATRRYAKRQITWLRRWQFVEWINMHEHSREDAIWKILDN